MHRVLSEESLKKENILFWRDSTWVCFCFESAFFWLLNIFWRQTIREESFQKCQCYLIQKKQHLCGMEWTESSLVLCVSTNKKLCNMRIYASGCLYCKAAISSSSKCFRAYARSFFDMCSVLRPWSCPYWKFSKTAPLALDDVWSVDSIQHIGTSWWYSP